MGIRGDSSGGTHYPAKMLSLSCSLATNTHTQERERKRGVVVEECNNRRAVERWYLGPVVRNDRY